MLLVIFLKLYWHFSLVSSCYCSPGVLLLLFFQSTVQYLSLEVLCKHLLLFFMGQHVWICTTVYIAKCFFVDREVTGTLCPMSSERPSHTPFGPQRPLQCLVCGGSLADLLPAWDHSLECRTASAGFAGSHKIGQTESFVKYMKHNKHAARLLDPTVSESCTGPSMT